MCKHVVTDILDASAIQSTLTLLFAQCIYITFRYDHSKTACRSLPRWRAGKGKVPQAVLPIVDDDLLQISCAERATIHMLPIRWDGDLIHLSLCKNRNCCARQHTFALCHLAPKMRRIDLPAQVFSLLSLALYPSQLILNVKAFPAFSGATHRPLGS